MKYRQKGGDIEPAFHGKQFVRFLFFDQVDAPNVAFAEHLDFGEAGRTNLYLQKEYIVSKEVEIKEMYVQIEP